MTNGSFITSTGTILNDSHAEVIARRGFLRSDPLYEQLLLRNIKIEVHSQTYFHCSMERALDIKLTLFQRTFYFA